MPKQPELKDYEEEKRPLEDALKELFSASPKGKKGVKKRKAKKPKNK